MKMGKKRHVGNIRKEGVTVLRRRAATDLPSKHLGNVPGLNDIM
jgi:hypothetical protein